MLHYIRNLLALPGLFMAAHRNFKCQQRFLNATLESDIRAAMASGDQSLDEHDYRKMTGYYGLAVAAIVGEAFCVLRGKSMTQKERTTLTLLGVLTGLFDDFFDKKKLPEKYIKQMVEAPETSISKNSSETLFVSFYLKALENAPDTQKLKSRALEVFHAQVESKKQSLPDTSLPEIERITRQKGGISLLFYREAFGPQPDKLENEMLSLLGWLGQLENDLFDFHKDWQAGIGTLATKATDMRALSKLYTSAMVEFRVSLQNTMHNPEAKKKFLRIAMLVITRGLVCLHQLEKLQQKTNSDFQAAAYSRKQLTCDMESPMNIVRWIHYYAKFTR